ncbi:hypothetical protein D3C78_19680 [compost metagenome]
MFSVAEWFKRDYGVVIGPAARHYDYWVTAAPHCTDDVKIKTFKNAITSDFIAYGRIQDPLPILYRITEEHTGICRKTYLQDKITGESIVVWHYPTEEIDQWDLGWVYRDHPEFIIQSVDRDATNGDRPQCAYGVIYLANISTPVNIVRSKLVSITDDKCIVNLYTVRVTANNRIKKTSKQFTFAIGEKALPYIKKTREIKPMWWMNQIHSRVDMIQNRFNVDIHCVLDDKSPPEYESAHLMIHQDIAYTRIGDKWCRGIQSPEAKEEERLFLNFM